MFSFGNAEKNMLSSKPKENKYYDESIKIDINNTNDSHALLANQVQENSICLDVGCGPGYIGDLLKIEKKCKVYGIELDKEAIKVAKNKGNYEEIFSFSISEEQNKEYKNFFENKIKFDYIVFGDVLEHIENPGKILAEFSKKLKKNGKFLISIPNIAHIEICRSLLNRKFNYNETGILDNTHLRFFTKNSFLEMIANINKNYHLCLKPRVVGKTIVESNEIIEKYPNIYSIVNKDKEASVVQYIYELEKVDNPAFKTPYSKDNFAQIEKAIQEKIAENQDLMTKLDDQKRKFEIQIEENHKLKKELELEQKKNYELLKSTSWKVTKPLRKIMDFVRKIKNSLNK